MRLRDGALVLLAAFGAACGGDQVVENYFRAVAAKDTQTVSSFAIVLFDKVPQSWKVLGSSPENRKPAPIAEIVKKHQEADKGLADNKKAYNQYYLDNMKDAGEAQELIKKGAPIPPRLTKVAEDWRNFIEKEKEYKRAVADTTQALEREKRVVTLSIGPNEDIEKLVGEMVEKTVDVAVTVDGAVENYTMTLHKYEMKDPAGVALPMSRWVVTGLDKK
ncbi:MAG: hypothetical protein NDJ94_01635 [Vicinamibacteria bacterium]|jgi:hypothetical protein|nr:hypothetical protein [Vicinamibacteria bacterium]